MRILANPRAEPTTSWPTVRPAEIRLAILLPRARIGRVWPDPSWVPVRNPCPQLMAGSPLRRIPPLSEADPAGPAGGSRRRLSGFGQGLLAAAILVAGVMVYASTWEISRRLSSRGEICLELPSGPTPPQPPLIENQLLRQQRVGRQLIAALPAALPGQRLRLADQLDDMVRDLDSLCRLSLFYTNEEQALLSLATASATLLIICLVLLAPQGIQNISRALRTVIFASGVLLGTAVNFLQLGEQQLNGRLVRQSYNRHDALLQHVSSSLANQRLEHGLSRGAALEPLTTPAAVARLISGIDAHRLALPDPRLQRSDSAAQSVWSRLLGADGSDGTGDGGRESPSGASAPGQKAAEPDP